MLFGTVALVLGKTIAGIAVVELIHEHVTECFGDDGRRRNDRDQRVAVHNGFLARGRWPARRALPEQRLGDRLVAVDEQPFGPDFQHAGGVAHGLERRLQNIDAIDFGRPDDAKPPSQRHGPDLGGQTVPAGRRQHLGLSKRFEEDEADGWRFFSAVFWWAALGIAALTAVAWIFAPELARLVGPGFSPEKQARLAHFLRIILPAQVFFLPGACVSALLYIRKQFLAPALTPLIYNGCIIAGGLLVTGRGMEGFCWGVLFGAALGSFLLPVVAARSSGSPLPEGIPAGLRLRFNLRHPLLKRLLLLALPLMLGVSIVAMDEQFVRIFGSMAGEGAVSLLSYARRIMLVPVGVVAQAAGVASFPFLAALAARGDDAGFDKTLGTALRGSMLVVIPLTAYMMAVALPTLGFIFEGGRFSAEETILAAPLLQILLLSVPFWVVQQVIGRAFYARQNTLTPAIVGTVATLAALPVYPLAVKLWGAFGVAMLTTLCLFVYTLALSWFWIRKHGTGAFDGMGHLLLKGFLLVLPGTLLAFFAVYGLPGRLPLWFPSLYAYLPAAMRHAAICGIAGVIFAVPYLLLTKLFMPEALSLRRRR